MAVDLGDLIDRARNEVSVPGGNLFPNASDDDWVNALASAFWDAKMNGWFAGFYEAEGLVNPDTAGDDDLSGTEQQMIVLWCGYRSVRAELLKVRTKSRSKAGPVESETERSATLLRDLLRDFRSKIDELRLEMVKAGRARVAVFDAVFLRDASLYYGDTSYLG